MACVKIERRLLHIKSVFFLFFIGSGVITPFLSIFLKNLGLHATEAGIIGGVLPLLVFPVRPIIVAVSERLNLRKVVLVASFLLFLASRICFLQVPTNSWNSQASLFDNITSQLLMSGQCIYDDIQVLDCSKVCASERSDASSKIAAPITNHQLYCKATTTLDGTLEYNNYMESCPFSSYQSPEDVNVFEFQSILEIQGFPKMNDTSPSKNKSVHCKEYISKGIVYQLKRTGLKMETWDACPNYTSLVCRKTTGDIGHRHGRVFGITFWISFFLFFTSSLSEYLIISGLDSIAYGQLRTTKSSYGLQRVFGSIGYALAALPAAFLLDVSTGGDESDIDFSIPVYAGSGILLITAVISGILDIPNQEKTENVRKLFCKIVKSPDVLTFFVVCAFLGACHLNVEMFLFWYLKELGSSQLVMGLAVVCRTLGELVCLVLSGPIIKRIGQIKALYICILANFVRMGAYSFLVNPWYVLPIEPLHGLTFCLMWAASSHHASIIAPPTILFTFQSLLAGIIISVGGGSGVLLSGYMFDTIGPVWTFRSYSISAGVILVAYSLVQACVFSRRQRKHPVLEEVVDTGDDTSVPLKLIQESKHVNVQI